VITEITVRTLSEKGEWIGRREIVAIKGAMKPSAYVARAYKHSLQNHGLPPDWAKKLGNSHWLFLESYIHADAKRNLESMSVHDAAQMLGATRRAIQDWVDQGVIPVLSGENREKGEERRILREAFIQDIPQLKKRLETAAVLARKHKQGNQVLEKLPQELGTRNARNRPSTRHRDHAERQRLRQRLKDALASDAARTIDALKSGKEKADARIEAPLTTAIKSNVVQSSDGITLKGLEASPDAKQNARLKALREHSAANLEARFKAAVEITAESAAEDRTIERVRARTVKEKSAAALEDKLTTAAETAAAIEERMEQRAILLAEEVQEQMFEDDLSSRKAVIMFIWEAISRGIPANIRIKISKKIFGS
jgi:hypothetical protein